ncbi:MAG: sulfite exporter TauE/SafE family protein [Dehalococcoidia bacterium]|nr:MAG: sulfite exporter TauE/SafE family protein [Dehalococcoidia bacterium]
MLTDIIAGLCIGLAAGVISGMLGVGGGTITIPGMVLLLDTEQHTAQGVALAAMLATALAGALVHYRQGNVHLKVATWIAPLAIAFSLLGAWAAGVVMAEWLTRVFAIALLIFGFRMLLLNRGDQGVSAG